MSCAYSCLSSQQNAPTLSHVVILPSLSQALVSRMEDTCTPDLQATICRRVFVIILGSRTRSICRSLWLQRRYLCAIPTVHEDGAVLGRKRVGGFKSGNLHA